MLYELTIQNLILTIILFFLVQGIFVIFLKFIFKTFPKIYDRYLEVKDNVIKLELNLSRKKALLAIIAFLAVAVGLGALVWLNYSMQIPIIEDSFPKNGGALDSYRSVITIKFNVPVVKNKINIRSSYNLKGRWEWDNYSIFSNLTTTGRFYLEDTLLPNQRVVFYIVGVSRIFFDENNEMGINFDSVPESQIVSETPIDKSENNSRDTKISFELDKPNDFVSEWIVKFDPNIQFKQTEEGKFINIVPDTSLNQDQVYSVTVTRRPVRYNFSENKIVEYGEQTYQKTFAFKTAREPSVEQFSPQGSSVKPNEAIRIVFNDPIVQDSTTDKVQIDPQTDGQFSWENERTLVFTPAQELPRATAFTVKLLPGIQSMVNGIIEKESNFNFHTIGQIKAIYKSPINNTVRVFEKNDVTITFDQEVDHDSAQSHFSIDPNVNGRFAPPPPQPPPPPPRPPP